MIHLAARVFTATALIAVVSGEAFGAYDVAQELAADAPRSADHPLTGRYEGSHILSQTVKAFDELTLPAGAGDAGPPEHFDKTQTAQGKVTRTIYVAPLGRSSVEVFKNYKDALSRKGLAPVFECAKEACGPSFMPLRARDAATVRGVGYSEEHGRLLDWTLGAVKDVRYALMKKTDPGGATYVAVYAAEHEGDEHLYKQALNGRVGVLVEVVEPRAQEMRMVTLKAEAIRGDLAREGRAVFYGIWFDSDRANLKQEADLQLTEVAKALKADPKLKVFIVGHTDNQGNLEYNTKLSQRRADAVVHALASRYGIDTGRLKAKGLGSLAPVATNRTDEGRAKNRRVEMIEQ